MNLEKDNILDIKKRTYQYHRMSRFLKRTRVEEIYRKKNVFTFLQQSMKSVLEEI